MECSENKFEFRNRMMARTKQFALRIIRLSQSLPKSRESDVIGKQVLRSGTSVAANYRAACRARSGAEFKSKISIVLEEIDETLFWIELLTEANIVREELVHNLYQEGTEILKIVAVARKNAEKPVQSVNSIIQ